MFDDEEVKVELPAIELLKQLGWGYVSGPSLAAERGSLRPTG